MTLLLEGADGFRQARNGVVGEHTHDTRAVVHRHVYKIIDERSPVLDAGQVPEPHGIPDIGADIFEPAANSVRLLRVGINGFAREESRHELILRDDRTRQLAVLKALENSCQKSLERAVVYIYYI